MLGKPIKLINYLYSQDKDKLYELKEYKEKRNNKQNAKYWKLLNLLALELRVSVEKLHKDMLRYYSQRYEILVPSEYKLRGIEYYDKKSIIKKDEKEYTVYHVYTPSHELNKKEFALLLSGLIHECKQYNIETLSDDELLELESIIKGE